MLQAMRSSAKYIWIIIVVLFVGGFLLAQTSGLLGRSPVTPTTAVATVNGEDILATTWYQTTQNLEQQATQQNGRGITLDERDRLANDAYDQLVGDVLLRQEYKRRGITVTDAEITEAARYNPPPQLMQSSELQTDGRFSIEKYQRLLASPAAKQEGLLLQLENYYRAELPKEKLFEQVVLDVYVPEEQMWERWRDAHDSAQVSFVQFGPERVRDSDVSVTDDEVRQYYDSHKKEFDVPGTARVSVLVIPRAVSAADSAAVRAHALAMRGRILGGEKFEDVARAESADSGSGANGGALGTGVRGRFVPEFEQAAYALKSGEISQPVATQFGIHLIRLDSRKGDTLTLHHILLKIQQSDSAASLTDRRADSLSKIAASADRPERLDKAARILKLPILRGEAHEGQPLTINGRTVPSVGAWAFKGTRAGETSDLYDDDGGYYIARLDSVRPAGTQTLNEAKNDIRKYLLNMKKVERAMVQARNFAKVAAGSSLESASRLMGMSIATTGAFTRFSGTQELRNFPEAAGAAFKLPVGAISEPVKTLSGVVVERVDRRVPADRAVWAAQKESQRQSQLQQLRQQKVREFLSNLRESAKITDRRKQIEASTRRSAQ